MGKTFKFRLRKVCKIIVPPINSRTVHPASGREMWDSVRVASGESSMSPLTSTETKYRGRSWGESWSSVSVFSFFSSFTSFYLIMDSVSIALSALVGNPSPYEKFSPFSVIGATHEMVLHQTGPCNRYHYQVPMYWMLERRRGRRKRNGYAKSSSLVRYPLTWMLKILETTKNETRFTYHRVEWLIWTAWYVDRRDFPYGAHRRLINYRSWLDARYDDKGVS